ncbi:MAG TPA: NrfD/PsrC family molybdoenzyme membrane anchor subunit [Acidimicrobiales bacterium]|nr:NrfD/PsrC family molybdoenzyme membrane anchor subunit [Acidimicrobiales bacterium]
MNVGRVTRAGLEGARPGREAPPGGTHVIEGLEPGRRRRRRDAEEFTSYYGRPVIKKPVWEAREIAGYFFLGGLAGASSLLAAGAQVTRRPTLARGAKLGAAGAIGLSLAALVKDLGRPARFLNMLRVLKPTSPMSVGTWIVSAYAPAAALAALTDLTGGPALLSTASTAAAATIGPLVAAYTGVLIADTAVPAWHGAYRELPFVFTSSAAMAAAGLGLVVSSAADAAPARRLAAAGVAAELAATLAMEHDLGELAAPYHEGRAGRLLACSRALALGGGVLAQLSRRSRPGRLLSGAALLAASACTRFGLFYGGVASADDPAATIGPQRARLEARRAAATAR